MGVAEKALASCSSRKEGYLGAGNVFDYFGFAKFGGAAFVASDCECGTTWCCNAAAHRLMRRYRLGNVAHGNADCLFVQRWT